MAYYKPSSNWPGVAHVELGHPISGFLLMIFVPILYLCFIVPGLIAHALCIGEAKAIARKKGLVW